MKITWTTIARKSYTKNIEFLIKIWNLKIAQDFILDIDVYTQQAANFSLILDKIEIYHDHVQSIFEESITQTLRSLMGARDNNAE